MRSAAPSSSRSRARRRPRIGGVGDVADERAAQVGGAVGGGDDGAQGQLGAVEALDDLGQGTDRGRAPRLELGEQGALGGGAGAGVGVVEGRHHGCRVRVVGADLHRERPLAGGGQHLDRVEQLGGLVDAAEAAQAGGGEDDGVEPALGDGPQPGVDVAAQPGDDQAEAERLELRAPTGRARCRRWRRRAARPG